jgi:FtsP/CotA-like multicopper oxidase with cupredoxin domain
MSVESTFQSQVLGKKMERREFLKFALASGGASFLVSAGLRPQRAAAAESMPLSPLILRPFRDPLPIPTASPLQPIDPNDLNPLPDPSAHQRWLPPAAYYRIPMLLREHRFTTSPVRGPNGRPTTLPPSWMSCFGGTFPGPLIRAWDDEPVLVRFENLLNPADGPWGDFGVPSTLTHLHNGHTAPESDGNPFHTHGEGYDSYYFGGNGKWYYDNLYLNMCPGEDDREQQSFLWFHDHRMDNTGANVYKGLVGLYYLHDALDANSETTGLRLPAGQYDIPLALYDCAFDDGVTPHDGLNGESSVSYGVIQDGQTHPENWGRLFFGHHMNHGFVGDVFTVNGIAYPYLAVKRRKYRFRFLDCSIARWYELQFMTGRPRMVPGLQGQWELMGAQQCLTMVQVASDGGLLPHPLTRDSFQIAPAKRAEMIVDFSRYMDGSPTRRGEVIYLTNTLEMLDGRRPTGRLPNGVPLMMFVIDGDPPTPDQSLVPPMLREGRPLPPPSYLAGLPHRRWELERGGGMWLINNEPFDHHLSYAEIPRGSEEVWEFVNKSGSWVHPMHNHMEEHLIISRNGELPPLQDLGKTDTTALHENEEVHIYQRFRTFTGRYVTHCHNLAHEDHAMMFGWNVVEP